MYNHVLNIPFSFAADNEQRSKYDKCDRTRTKMSVKPGNLWAMSKTFFLSRATSFKI